MKTIFISLLIICAITSYSQNYDVIISKSKLNLVEDNISEIEQQKIIDYIESYRIDSLLLKYNNIDNFLIETFYLSEYIAIRQQALSLYWDIARLNNSCRKFGHYSKFIFQYRRSDYNIEIREKIIAILNQKKYVNDEEYIKKLIYNRLFFGYINQFKDTLTAKEVYNTNENYHTFITNIVEKSYTENYTRYSINRDLYLLVGWLDMVETVPTLQQYLDMKKFYNIELVFALTRLGIDTYLEEILNIPFYEFSLQVWAYIKYPFVEKLIDMIKNDSVVYQAFMKRSNLELIVPNTCLIEIYMYYMNEFLTVPIYSKPRTFFNCDKEQVGKKLLNWFEENKNIDIINPEIFIYPMYPPDLRYENSYFSFPIGKK